MTSGCFTGEAEAWESWIQGQPWLSTKFWVSLGYLVTLCYLIKQKQPRTKTSLEILDHGNFLGLKKKKNKNKPCRERVSSMKNILDQMTF